MLIPMSKINEITMQPYGLKYNSVTRSSEMTNHRLLQKPSGKCNFKIYQLTWQYFAVAIVIAVAQSLCIFDLSVTPSVKKNLTLPSADYECSTLALRPLIDSDDLSHN